MPTNIKAHCGATNLDTGAPIEETFLDNGDGTYSRLVGASGTVSIGVVTIADGGDVAQGASTDAAGVSSIIGQLKQLVANTTGAADHYTRSDTFTAAANGVTVDATASPGLVYTLSVKSTGATATHWNVVLEGSLDGTNWTTLITHADTTPDVDGAAKSATARPMLYFRTRCVSVTLGSATNVVATLLALR